MPRHRWQQRVLVGMGLVCVCVWGGAAGDIEPPHPSGSARGRIAGVPTCSCRHCSVVRLSTQASLATPAAVSPPSTSMARRAGRGAAAWK